MPQGAEQGGQSAGLRGRHLNQLSSVLGLRLTPIVPAHHCSSIEQRLLIPQQGVNLRSGKEAL
jgi:hypothetical protein